MPKPAIILVKPQLGENIGKAARAMLNFGLEDLRIVAPRDGWPNPDALPSASGADHVIENAKLFDTTGEAIADLNLVFAATVRERGMQKDVFDPEGMVKKIGAQTGKAGILFGREAAGLANEDVVLCDAIVTVPVNPDFGSLNLAVAVGLISYECYRGEGAFPERQEEEAATKADMQGLFDHLEGALDDAGYFYPPERKGPMVASIRNLLTSATLTRQQVQTLRGVIKALDQGTKK